MMSDEKCLEVIEFYRQFLEQNEAIPIEVGPPPSNDLLDLLDAADLIAKRNSLAKSHKKILNFIKSILRKEKSEAKEIDYDTSFSNKQEAMNHLLSMLPKMAKFARDNREDKFMRWLGFISGTLGSFDNISNKKIAYNHLFWMSIEIKKILKSGDRLAFFFWLGVMQGIFCSLGCFTLNELRNHLRPDDEPETS